jgi:hypothetical protein
VEASGKTDEQFEIDVSKVSAKDASAPASTAENAEDLIDAKMMPPVQFCALTATSMHFTYGNHAQLLCTIQI